MFVLSYTLQDLAYRTTDAATGADVDLLEWDVFGPSWPQGMAGLDVSVTLPDDLDAELVRPPRGMLGWSILTAGEWLTPEADSPPGAVTYAFSNDQNLPPHAQAQFSMPFAAGTFAMLPLTPLFWVQTLGPLAPLVILTVTLLFALAARAVAWSDAQGRPWFVAQYDPPPGVTPRLAAQVLQTPRTMELAGALRRAAHGTHAAKHAAARVAHRTGRFGDRLPARFRYLRAAERREQYTRGLRRIPRGFVRDFFIATPIALTVLQWGLVRQLSHQAPPAIVWWPTAFVLVSTVVALAVLGITRTARPLTRRGALLTQHLRGIQVYAERTEDVSAGDETSESVGTVAGFDTHVLELRRGEGGYPFDLTVTDTGVRVDFPAGTFAGPSATERGLAATRAVLPITAALLWGILAALGGVAGLLLRAAGSSALTARGAVRVLIRWVPAACALAATIVMFWVSGGMDGDDPTFFWFAGAAGVAVLGAIAGWYTTRRRAAKQ